MYAIQLLALEVENDPGLAAHRALVRILPYAPSFAGALVVYSRKNNTLGAACFGFAWFQLAYRADNPVAITTVSSSAATFPDKESLPDEAATGASPVDAARDVRSVRVPPSSCTVTPSGAVVVPIPCIHFDPLRAPRNKYDL